jgi:hypothetical protein
LFEADVPVHYGFIFLSAKDDQPDLMETRAGQRNGLCGAAVPGVLSMVTGLHTGRVPFVVEWHDAEPALDPEWEEVVEVPFAPRQPDLALTSFQDYFEVRLPAAGSLRARYCAIGMDAAHGQDTIFEEEPTVDRYLLALWPAAPAPDAVVRQTGPHAAYWHREAQAVRVPSEEERAAAARATAEQERFRAERSAAALEGLMWAGRPPTRRLREVGGNVLGVARSDRDLLDTFAALDADTQRAAARWLARRAFEIAGLDRLDWVTPALDALDRGDPLPAPFTDLAAVFPLVLPSGARLGAVAVRGDATAGRDDANAGRGDATAGRGAGGPARRVHRPSFAVPAIFSAADPDPLRALVDTFSHAAATFDDRRAELVAELRERYLPPTAAGPPTMGR